jgi:UDP-glucose 4-epimerase
VPVEESAPQRPINPYGQSKLAFEQVLSWYEEIHGLVATTFRYVNAAGASARFGEHHRVETHLIPTALFVAQGRVPEIELFGADYETPDGTAIRDYVHVLDLAEIHQRAVEQDVPGAFNLGTGQGRSVREVIAACARVTGRKIPVREGPRRPGDPPVLVAATGKAVRELGWAPRFVELEETVRTAWDWHQAHPEGYGD